MNKKYLLLIVGALLFIQTNAQDSISSPLKFNRWSFEGGAGLTKPYFNFNPGYQTATPDFLAGEFGIRYMISEYFGLKLNVGYNQFTNRPNSPEFSTNEYRLDMQGVVNMGRVLKFEEWTKRLNLLAHAGAGAGRMDYGAAPDTKDYVGNVVGGLTGQIKLSNHIALYADLSTYGNIRQKLSFNGGPANTKHMAMVVNSTVGLSIYLGKNKNHADWVAKDDERYKSLERRTTAVEQKIKEKDTKTDEIQQEIKKVQADVQALNQRVENVEKAEPAKQSAGTSLTYDSFVKGLIQDGFTNIYFEFNSDKISESSLPSINLISSFMQKNPGVRVQLKGYADERGTENYNRILSEKRAKAVANLLNQSGIDASRLTAVGEGVDRQVEGNSSADHKLARRVSFVVEGSTSGEKKPEPTGSIEKKNTGDKPEYVEFAVKSVHFVENKYYLTDYSKGKLDMLLSFLQRNPGYNINLYGFTDQQSNEEYNKTLAGKRLASVVEYLTSKGLNKSRIYNMEAVGDKYPIADNTTPQGRLNNRRVEFEIFRQ